MQGKQESGAGAGYYLYLCTRRYVSGFLQHPGGLLIYRTDETAGGLYLFLLCQTGLFQLLAVCIINLIIVLVCLGFFRESRVLKGILTVISLCTYIMVASSAYRMILYIQICQLTFLRIIVLWALAVTALVLGGIIVTIFRPGFRLFRYCVTIVTVFYILLAFAKPDYWIARYNMQFVDFTAVSEEPSEDSYRDFYYLSHLSADAAPILASPENYEFLKNKSYSMEEYFSRMERKSEGMGIRGFNVSRYLAGKAIDNTKK